MKNLEMHSARKSAGAWLLPGLAAAFILTGVCLRIFFLAAPLEPKWFEVTGILLGGWAVAPISRMLRARVDPVRARRAEIEDRDERLADPFHRGADALRPGDPICAGLRPALVCAVCAGGGASAGLRWRAGLVES